MPKNPECRVLVVLCLLCACALPIGGQTVSNRPSQQAPCAEAVAAAIEKLETHHIAPSGPPFKIKIETQGPSANSLEGPVAEVIQTRLKDWFVVDPTYSAELRFVIRSSELPPQVKGGAAILVFSYEIVLPDILTVTDGKKTHIWAYRVPIAGGTMGWIAKDTPFDDEAREAAQDTAYSVLSNFVAQWQKADR